MASKSTKALIWSTTFEFSRLFVRVFGLYVLSKTLTPTDYGQMAVFLVGAAVASFIPELLRFEILRRNKMAASDYLAYHKVSTWSLFAYLPAVLLLMFVLNPTAMDPVELATLILVPLAVYITMEHAFCVRVIKLQRHYKQKLTSRADFLGYVASLVLIAIPGAWLGLGPYALVLSYIGNSAMRAAIIFRAVRLTHRRHPRQRTSGVAFRAFFYRTRLEAARIATNKVLNQMPSTMIGKNFGAATLGNFNRSSYVVDQFANGVGRAVGSVVLRYAAINFGAADNKNTRAELLNAAICILLVALVYLNQNNLKDVFIWFFGPNWLDAAEIFPIVAYALPLKMTTKISVQILKGIERSSLILYMQIAAVCLILLAALIADDIETFCIYLVAENALRKIVYFGAIVSSRNAR